VQSGWSGSSAMDRHPSRRPVTQVSPADDNPVVTADSDAKLARERMRRWIVWLPPALVAVIVGLLLASLIPRPSPAPVASPSPSSISSQPHACAAADVLVESKLEGAT